MLFPPLNDAQRLLLNLLCNPRADPLEDWLAWSRRTDWLNRPVDSLSAELLPAVYQRLLAAGQEFPDLQRLKGVYRRAWYRQERQGRPIADALAMLSGSGCPVLLLGAAANAVVSEPRRFFSQMVCLVPEERHAALIPKMQAMSWEVTDRFPGYGVRLKHPDGTWIWLNQRAASEQRFHGADAEIWENSLPAEFGGVPVRIPSPDDLLLMTIQHGRRPETRSSAYWLVDTCALLRSRPPDLDWACFEKAAGARGVSLRVAVALESLNEAFHIGVPQERIDRLRAGAAWFELREETILAADGHVRRYRQAYSDYLRHAGRPSGPAWWWGCLQFVVTEYNPPRGLRLLPWLAVRLSRRFGRA